MINAHLYTAEYIRLIESGLEPSEVGIAVCTFDLPETNARRTTVLTNRHVRFIRFETNWQGKKPRITLNTAIAVRAITGISTEEWGQGFLGRQKVFQLIFWWEGYQETLVTIAKVEGEAFAEKLKEVVAGRDVVSSPTSLADEIQKLAQLTKEGILTQDEWLRAKDRLIGSKIEPSKVEDARSRGSAPILPTGNDPAHRPALDDDQPNVEESLVVRPSQSSPQCLVKDCSPKE